LNKRVLLSLEVGGTEEAEGSISPYKTRLRRTERRGPDQREKKVKRHIIRGGAGQGLAGKKGQYGGLTRASEISSSIGQLKKRRESTSSKKKKGGKKEEMLPGRGGGEGEQKKKRRVSGVGVNMGKEGRKIKAPPISLQKAMGTT